MRKHIDRFNCDYCQKNKLEGRGYGLLPEWEVRSIPFEVSSELKKGDTATNEIKN